MLWLVKPELIFNNINSTQHHTLLCLNLQYVIIAVVDLSHITFNRSKYCGKKILLGLCSIFFFFASPAMKVTEEIFRLQHI